jgi:hypothetical protein
MLLRKAAFFACRTVSWFHSISDIRRTEQLGNLVRFESQRAPMTAEASD